MTNYKSGFTLVELLVVITLISLISGLGFISFNSYSKSQAIKQTGDNLKQAINVARFDAVSSVKPASSISGGECTSSDQLMSYKFNFCDNTTCISTNPNIDYEVVAICGAKSLVVKAEQLARGISFSSAGIDPSILCKSITFPARTGSSEGVPCQINLGDNESTTFNILINESGNVSIQ